MGHAGLGERMIGRLDNGDCFIILPREVMLMLVVPTLNPLCWTLNASIQVTNGRRIVGVVVGPFGFGVSWRART